MRGGKLLPSNIVRLRGNPGKRRLNDAEPRPAVKAPACPPCLGEEARKEWQRLSKELAAFGLLTTVPRKNGKSTLSAGIALYLLVADGEQGAEVHSATTVRDQARIVFDEAKRMVSSSPALKRRVQVLTWRQSRHPLDGRQRPVAQDPAGNLKPAQDKSTERIDGMSPLVMAIGRALVAQEQPQPSYQVFWV